MNKVSLKEMILSNKEKAVKFGVIFLVILIALLVFLVTNGKEDEKLQLEKADSKESSENVEEKEDIVIVDISGAIKTPQVVELESGSRVEDAIVAAGGLLAEADISQINRAELLTDGEKIYIPKKGETVSETTQNSSSTATSSSSTQSSKKVNINTADSTQLQELKGVGPVTAEKIISYRTTNGKFKTIEDIKNVDGIGDKTYENFKNQITV